MTRIAGEGVETRSRPAATGDMMVRNRCPETGNEAYLVRAATFAERYRGPFSEPDAEGWREFRPLGPEMRYFLVAAGEEPFRFEAPWGEPMRAGPGDAIVRDPAKPGDIYRVAAMSFACTYEVPSRRGGLVPADAAVPLPLRTAVEGGQLPDAGGPAAQGPIRLPINRRRYSSLCREFGVSRQTSTATSGRPAR